MSHRLVAMAVAAALSGTAVAGEVTVGFNSGVPGFGGLYTADYIEAGFRFSPSCHLDSVTDGRGFAGSPALGWDGASCEDGASFPIRNPEYKGPPNTLGWVFVERVDRGPFDLLSFYLWSPSSMHNVRSSAGGSLSWPLLPPLPPTVFTLSGYLWSNLTWVMFGPDAGGAPQGILDQVIFRTPVSEPGTLALLALGCAMALRRKG